MGKIHEITVLCEQGDPARLSTWSNVPYFLTKTLEEKGIKVNRVNLHPGTNRFHKLFYKLWNVFSKGVFRNKFYTYRRTGLYFWLTNRKIKKAVTRYPNSDAFISMTYNVSARHFTDKPVVLFSDWTTDYDARVFRGVSPSELSYHERKIIERQRRNIESADCVICLFPGIAADMQQVYKNPDIHYIGNVVNTLYEPEKETLLPRKQQSADILFVGKKHYLKGAEELLEAFRQLRQTMPEARLHIIGIKAGKLGVLPEGTTCYGYLAKENPDACKTYYDLLSRCRLFINTTPRWGAFSASVEAMYHYMPVIITPYSEFVTTFGKEIPFGTYHSENAGAETLCREMKTLLTDPDFEKKAEAAHNAVSGMTWNNFVNNLLEKLQ